MSNGENWIQPSDAVVGFRPIADRAQLRRERQKWPINGRSQRRSLDRLIVLAVILSPCHGG